MQVSTKLVNYFSSTYDDIMMSAAQAKSLRLGKDFSIPFTTSHGFDTSRGL